MEIDIFQYTVANNPEEVAKCLISKGFEFPENWEQLTRVDRINYLAKTAENVLENSDKDCKMKFLSLHPDFDTFEEYFNQKNASKFLKVEGDENAKPTKETPSVDKNIMENMTAKNIFIGFGIALGTIYILKNVMQ